MENSEIVSQIRNTFKNKFKHQIANKLKGEIMETESCESNKDDKTKEIFSGSSNEDHIFIKTENIEDVGVKHEITEELMIKDEPFLFEDIPQEDSNEDTLSCDKFSLLCGNTSVNSEQETFDDVSNISREEQFNETSQLLFEDYSSSCDSAIRNDSSTMEQGFIAANCFNLPRIDVLMLGEYLASNKDFRASKFRDVKTSLSSRPSYGDDTISYVQLKREGKICTVKCKIFQEHAKLYAVTLTVDEIEEKIASLQCHDCVLAQGGCRHALALLMWLHRRSEEPSFTEVKCYWPKSKLSKVGTTMKFITAKKMSNGSPALPSNPTVLEKFLEEAKKRNLSNCNLLRYHTEYICND